MNKRPKAMNIFSPEPQSKMIVWQNAQTDPAIWNFAFPKYGHGYNESQRKNTNFRYRSRENKTIRLPRLFSEWRRTIHNRQKQPPIAWGFATRPFPCKKSMIPFQQNRPDTCQNDSTFSTMAHTLSERP
jgi:hypothetical protein